MAGRLVAFDRPMFRRQLSGPWDMWSDPWSSDIGLPSRVLDQHFGLGLLDEDLMPPQMWRGLMVRPRRQPAQQASGMSEVQNTDKDFRVNLDVSHFAPEELSIKTVDNRVIIHGKHEEKQDEHGFIQREFRRTYVLPTDVDPNTVKSSLTADGVLSIKAPKKTQALPTERVIPIERMDVEPVSSPESK
nr:small heat shock protein [Ailoscolex lacteospumosus]